MTQPTLKRSEGIIILGEGPFPNRAFLRAELATS